MAKPCQLIVTTRNVRVKSIPNLSYCRSNSNKLEDSSVQEMYTPFSKIIVLYNFYILFRKACVFRSGLECYLLVYTYYEKWFLGRVLYYLLP